MILGTSHNTVPCIGWEDWRGLVEGGLLIAQSSCKGKGGIILCSLPPSHIPPCLAVRPRGKCFCMPCPWLLRSYLSTEYLLSMLPVPSLVPGGMSLYHVPGPHGVGHACLCLMPPSFSPFCAVNDVKNAVQSVSSYMLFDPSDEVMQQNLVYYRFYRERWHLEEEDFNPRPVRGLWG